jgi:flagellar assembly protein FliH
LALEAGVKNLSKVYKNTSLFVPEQILPRQEYPREPVWRDMVTGTYSRNERQGSFIPDKTSGGAMIADKKNNLAPELFTTSKEEREKTLAPAIDLELISQEAFAEGVVEGRRQADKDFGTCAGTLRTACDQLTNLHETILRNNTREMHTLVMEIAEKIIRHSISEQSETILATIEDAIRLAVKSEEFEIRINPEDLEVIKQKRQDIINEINGLNNIILKADKSVERGGCLLESVNCTVDATIGSQLQVVSEALQSQARTPTPLHKGP